MTFCKSSIAILIVCATLLNIVKGSNYDEYIKSIISRNNQMKEAYLESNPTIRQVYEHVNSPEYLSGHRVLKEIPNGASSYELSDDDWNDFVQELLALQQEKNLSNERYKNVDLESEPISIDDEEISPYIFQNIQERNLVPRKIEVPYQNELYGEHKIKGGSSEIGTWLDYALQGAKAQDMENEQGSSTVSNVESDLDVKDSKLPAYCNPPNPCPIGYDPSSLPSPCDANIEDTKEFNQAWIYNKMAKGECSCDSEHMKECPDSKSMSDGLLANDDSSPFMKGEKRSQLVAKKSNYLHFQKRSPEVLKRNPFIRGRILRRVSKKDGSQIHFE